MRSVGGAHVELDGLAIRRQAGFPGTGHVRSGGRGRLRARRPCRGLLRGSVKRYHRRPDDRDRHQYRERRGGGEHPSAAVQCGAIARGVHHGEQPVLELARARHPQRDRRRGSRAERVRDLQEVPRVFARLGAGREHAIVAGELALDPHPPRRPPHAGVRPVDRACERGEHLRGAVAARDVGELVQQHREPAVVRPARRRCGNEDRRPPRTEGHRHDVVRALQQSNRPLQAKPARGVFERLRPLRVGHDPRVAYEPAKRHRLEAEPDEQEQHAHDVECDRCRDPVDRRPRGRRSLLPVVSAFRRNHRRGP